MGATGGEEPVVVMAYGADQDFSFLDLRRPAFDLTDRGVAGRPAASGLDAFVYTERGVYRTGETVHITALLRDPQTAGSAIRGKSCMQLPGFDRLRSSSFPGNSPAPHPWLD